MAMAAHFERWAQQYSHEGELRGIEKGIEKGIKQGEALALLKLVTRRFGSPPPDIEDRIHSASPEQLEEWLDRLLPARSLDDIFRD